MPDLSGYGPPKLSHDRAECSDVSLTRPTLLSKIRVNLEQYTNFANLSHLQSVQLSDLSLCLSAYLFNSLYTASVCSNTIRSSNSASALARLA